MKNSKSPYTSNSEISSNSANRSSGEQKSLPGSRRGFLKTAGLGAAALTASSVLPISLTSKAAAVEIGPPSSKPHTRGNDLEKIRKDAAKTARDQVTNDFPHATNGDEETYADSHYEGNFTKSFPLNANGLVDPRDYRKLLAAIAAGTQEAFRDVPAGGRGTLAGPFSPLVFQIEGADSPVGSSLFVPPSINSAGGAAEMVELYWESYLRDVPFIDYGSNPLVGQAVADVNRLSAFAGPRPVTAQNLFRYPFVDATVGPYVSQILYQTHQIDSITLVPQLRTRAQVADPNTGAVLTGPGTGVDFMTNLGEYLTVETGNGAVSANVIDPVPRFIRNVRDVGNLANSDTIYSIYFRASIILGALGVRLDPNNPYADDPRIGSFSTFSTAWMQGLLGNVHKAEANAFYAKWYVHRKVRPEQFGNLVDGVMGGRFTLNPNLHSDLLNSSVLPLIFERNRQLNVKRGMGTTGSFLLPQESSGGSPTHPDPPAGHAFTAGACVTMMKAVLDVGTPENPKPWPRPAVVASADGLSLVPTGDTNLTVLGELNKLAANVSEGRNMLGIHSRVGGNMLGMTQGEAVAISVLQEHAATYPEKFSGWTLTKFDGTTIVIGGNQ
jgi:hypothetical protein